ncbi:MAG: helix-turn-helix transcriptional regulator [Taibaiella sp.]|nr:helix-turn-helix transcriptional regulator [Taibaiella sp.]
MYGSKIAIIRLARGYTHEYVSKKLGIAQNTYSKIEKDNKVKMDDPLLESIANVLGVSIDDIKSPTPIVMNLQINEHMTTHAQSSLNERLIEELSQQLKIKDEFIQKLLSLLEK